MAVLGGMAVVIINLSSLRSIPEAVPNKDGSGMIDIRSMKIGTEIINIMSLCSYITYTLIFYQTLKVYKKLSKYYARYTNSDKLLVMMNRDLVAYPFYILLLLTY